MALMPIDQRLGLRDDRGVANRHHRTRNARIAEMSEARERSRFCGVRGFADVQCEEGSLAVETEEDAYRVIEAERIGDFRSHQTELEWRRGLLGAEQERLKAPYREDERGRIMPFGFDPVGIGAF